MRVPTLRWRADGRKPTGRYCEISGVRQHNGWLYLGSLAESSVGRVALPGAAGHHPRAAEPVA